MKTLTVTLILLALHLNAPAFARGERTPECNAANKKLSQTMKAYDDKKCDDKFIGTAQDPKWSDPECQTLAKAVWDANDALDRACTEKEMEPEEGEEDGGDASGDE